MALAAAAAEATPVTPPPKRAADDRVPLAASTRSTAVGYRSLANKRRRLFKLGEYIHQLGGGVDGAGELFRIFWNLHTLRGWVTRSWRAASIATTTETAASSRASSRATSSGSWSAAMYSATSAPVTIWIRSSRSSLTGPRRTYRPARRRWTARRTRGAGRTARTASDGPNQPHAVIYPPHHVRSI